MIGCLGALLSLYKDEPLQRHRPAMRTKTQANLTLNSRSEKAYARGKYSMKHLKGTGSFTSSLLNRKVP